jgi:hypothetical protein
MLWQGAEMVRQRRRRLPQRCGDVDHPRSGPKRVFFRDRVFRLPANIPI